jgi:hypothetical protein
MGFNKRRMDSERAAAAAKEAEARRALGSQILADAVRVVAAWNARQEKRMPMLFSPNIGAAITARYWFLWVRGPACRTTQSVDIRTLDRHPDAAVTSGSGSRPYCRAKLYHPSKSCCLGSLPGGFHSRLNVERTPLAIARWRASATRTSARILHRSGNREAAPQPL